MLKMIPVECIASSRALNRRRSRLVDCNVPDDGGAHQCNRIGGCERSELFGRNERGDLKCKRKLWLWAGGFASPGYVPFGESAAALIREALSLT